MRRGTGWLLFAWLMLLAGGAMNVIQGFAALGQSRFWGETGSTLVYGDLRQWGWFLLLWGVVLLVAAVNLWRGGRLGRWVGIGAAALNLILQMAFAPAYPLWAVAIMSVDMLVIYALAVYGGAEQA